MPNKAVAKAYTAYWEKYGEYYADCLLCKFQAPGQDNIPPENVEKFIEASNFPPSSHPEFSLWQVSISGVDIEN